MQQSDIQGERLPFICSCPSPPISLSCRSFLATGDNNSRFSNPIYCATDTSKRAREPAKWPTQRDTALFADARTSPTPLHIPKLKQKKKDKKRKGKRDRKFPHTCAFHPPSLVAPLAHSGYLTCLCL
mmetsp:Transcript_47994/g.94759  ORF Transcript_47994/g.94759 Transcript_47994/m.94759 type:complete len:127 (-) Transcript_47994:3270-3650(-)